MSHDELQHYVNNSIGHLTFLRSQFIIGAALAAKYPTEDSWETACNDPTLVSALEDFHIVLMQLEQESEVDDRYLDETNVAELTSQSYERALEAVLGVSDALDVPAEDLVVMLLNN